MNFSKDYKRKEKRDDRIIVPHDFWCPECNGTGLVPATVVLRKGRVSRRSCACRCDKGAQMMRSMPRMLSYTKATEYGVLEPQARTHRQHWLHATRRAFDLVEDERTVAMIDFISAAEEPFKALREWQRANPPHGPLSAAVKKATP